MTRESNNYEFNIHEFSDGLIEIIQELLSTLDVDKNIEIKDIEFYRYRMVSDFSQRIRGIQDGKVGDKFIIMMRIKIEDLSLDLHLNFIIDENKSNQKNLMLINSKIVSYTMPRTPEEITIIDKVKGASSLLGKIIGYILIKN